MREKIYLVGLFPTIFTSRCKLLICDPFMSAGIKTEHHQLNEYPAEMREELGRLAALINKLVSRGFKIYPVHSCSPLGIWLSFRYSLKNGFYAVIHRRAIRIAGDVEKVVTEIEAVSQQNLKRRPQFRWER